MPVNLVTVADRALNHYVLDCRGGKLLIDPGWAGRLGELRHGLRRHGIELANIRYVMATHFHPDHAGLAQEVKLASSARLLIHAGQLPHLGGLLAFYARKGSGYAPIEIDPDDVVVEGTGRAALAALGLDGELVETPGHSPDSVSLALDDGRVFIGDLHLPGQVDEGAAAAVSASWRKLIASGARTAYPGHGEPFAVAGILPD